MSWVDRLKNALYLFSTCISYIQKDKSLFIIPIFMTVSNIGIIILIVGSVFFGLALQNFIFKTTNPVVFFASGLFLFYLWNTFLAAIQTWMVHEVVLGKDASVVSGLKRALSEFLDIIIFTVASVIITLLTSVRSSNSSGETNSGSGMSYQPDIQSGLQNTALGLISIVTEIASKLVLPGMIITEKSFFGALKDLKIAVGRIPEIATFELAIRPLSRGLGFINFCVSIFFGSIFGIYTGIAIFVSFQLIISMFSIMINQIYYTLLYLAFIEKKKIPGLKLVY